MLQYARYVLLLTLLSPDSIGSVHGASHTTAHDTPNERSAAAFLIQASTATCHSRTANYITHTLPQQCLRSSWSAPSPAIAPTGADTAVFSGAVPTDTTSMSTSTIIHSLPADRSYTGASTDVGEPTLAMTASDVPILSTSESTTTVSEISLPSPASSAPTPTETDLEPDSPLDNVNFLSFEEWKKQNLARAGQSPENFGQGRSSSGGVEGRRRPDNINDALDSLGEDTEIELDFGGFGGGDGRTTESVAGYSKTARRPNSSEDVKAATETVPADSRLRSKDAGKTCKERFNYASFDCAATVLKTNPQCKSSSSVLVENKDSYMLNECAANNKFIIVELCDDILVDTIVLANFEFFSSMFRTFRVSVSDRYLVKLDRWKILGDFEARNSRDIQAFLIENPLIWARYVRIEFLSHYGNEYYCPVSLLRVHGTTMMEEFRHQEEIARGEDDLDEDVDVVNSDADDKILSISAPELPSSGGEVAHTFSDAYYRKGTDKIHSASKSSTLRGPQTSSGRIVVAKGGRTRTNALSTITHLAESSPSASAKDSVVERDESSGQSSADATAGGSLIAAVKTHSRGSIANNTVAFTTTGSVPTTHVPASSEMVDVTATRSPGSVSDAESPATEVSTTISQDDTTTVPLPLIAATVSSKILQHPSKDNHRQASTAMQPQPSNPPTQESFFKSIHKRLQMLEVNSTLSLQYIEEQSRILRDAFAKVEKRQLAKTEKFLDHLNSTVIAELKGFRQQYDQLWQSTVIELEDHRERHQHEILAISARLTIVADELVFQKRMAVVQSTLLLLCLGLVLFVRSGVSHLEMPLVQQMMNKSQSALRLQFESPAGSPSPLRQGRRVFRGFNGFRSSSSHLSEGSPDGQNSTILEYTPPTPTSGGEDDRPASGVDVRVVELDAADQALKPLPAAPPVRETQSGPATPRGTRESAAINWDQDTEVMAQHRNILGRRSPRTDEDTAAEGIAADLSM